MFEPSQLLAGVTKAQLNTAAVCKVMDPPTGQRSALQVYYSYTGVRGQAKNYFLWETLG